MCCYTTQQRNANTLLTKLTLLLGLKTLGPLRTEPKIRSIRQRFALTIQRAPTQLPVVLPSVTALYSRVVGFESQ